MQPPMIGSWDVTVHRVRPFQIHGDLYYELQIARDDAPEAIVAVRVPEHATEGVPQAGDRLSLTFLMGQVTAAKKR